MRRDVLRILGVGLVCIGLSAFGWKIAVEAGRFGNTVAGVETLIKHGTIYRTATITRKVKGRVITLPGGTRVVHVPMLIVHTGGHTIRVPAHNLRIHRVKHGAVAATVAEPLVPVTVTIYVPSDPVTVTATETLPPSTETVTIPTTVTLPLEPDPTTSDQQGGSTWPFSWTDPTSTEPTTTTLPR